VAQLDSELRAYAKKQLKNKQEFRVYLRVYLAVVALTATIWFLTSPGSYFWPIWVIFGMGIGAVFIGLEAYGKLGNKPITDADIDAEVERLGRKQ
jgi:fatty acid desaturase